MRLSSPAGLRPFRRRSRCRGFPAGRLALLAVVLTSAPAFSGVEVQVHDGQVDLRASAAPLSEVLDRLAKQTGMKLVFDGPPPRQSVTMTILGRSAVETVLTVFEGLGINYAFSTDATGTAVQTLLVTTVTASSSSSTASSPPAVRAVPGRPPLRQPRRPPESEPDLEPFDEPEPPDDPALNPPGQGAEPPGIPPEGAEAPGAARQTPPTSQAPVVDPFPRAIPYAPGPFAPRSEPARPSQPAGPLPTAPTP